MRPASPPSDMAKKKVAAVLAKQIPAAEKRQRGELSSTSLPEKWGPG